MLNADRNISPIQLQDYELISAEKVERADCHVLVLRLKRASGREITMEFEVDPSFEIGPDTDPERLLAGITRADGNAMTRNKAVIEQYQKR